MRRDFITNPGGDCIQAEATARWLKIKYGVDVAFVTAERSIEEAFDLYHIFNLTRISNSFEVAEACVRSKMPYVLSPIWHSVDMMRKFYEPSLPFGIGLERYFGLRELFYERFRLNKSVISASVSWKNAVDYVVMNSALVLPNSDDELRELEHYLNASIGKSMVVPNGLDVPVSMKKKALDKSKCYVCSGRVEPRKNTELVIRSFLASDAPAKGFCLIVLGAASKRHKGYFEKVMKYVDGVVVKYIPAVSYEDALCIYREAYGMIHASHFETTGLVALEALSLGCKVVMTQATYKDPYFLDYVEYCDPAVMESIVNTINNTLSDPKSTPESAHFDSFSWERAADLTYQAYKMVN